jgi:hypothetical protein
MNDTPRRAVVAGAFALLLAALAGCASGDGPTDPTPTAPSTIARPESTAKLGVVSPANGAVVEAGDVPLKVTLDNAELVATASTDVRPDQGHLHVVLDDELLDMTSGLKGRLPNVEPGQHVLRVEFVASDHAPFDPRVVADVVFEAR